MLNGATGSLKPDDDERRLDHGAMQIKIYFILRYPDMSYNDPRKSERMLVAVRIGKDRGQAEYEILLFIFVGRKSLSEQQVQWQLKILTLCNTKAVFF